MSALQIGIILIISIAALIGIGAMLVYLTLQRLIRSVIAPFHEGYGQVLTQEIQRNQLDPNLMDIKYDKLFLKNSRNQELTARLYLAQPQTDRYLLFLHGYHYPWVGALKYLPMLLELGFNVLVPDQQAHGESQGDCITFGALESDDALEWLEQIRRHAQTMGFERARIGVMGESMGAVTALMTTAKANSTHVPMVNKPLFCIADCPFSDWKSILLRQAKKRYSFNLSPLLPMLRTIIRKQTGVELDEVSSVKAAAAIRVPTLLFHGTEDHLVPAEMSQQIAAANESNITLHLVDGAHHMNCYTTNPQEYRNQLLRLLAQVPFESEATERYAVYL